MAAQRGQRGRSVYGNAGGGLVDAHWAANEAVARVGRDGELKTAEILDAIARPDGPVVLHDLNIPIPGFTANIDHAVVSGRRVLLVDSKAWAAGFYWTVGGVTRRGWKPFKHADKKTMEMARDAITRFFGQHGVTAEVVTPVVVVWPTGRSKPTRVWALKLRGARAVLGTSFSRSAKKLAGRKAADPAVVNALLRLVNGPSRSAPPAAQYARPQAPAQPVPPSFGPVGVPASDDFGPTRAPVFPSAAPAPVNTAWLDPDDPFARPFTQPGPPATQPGALPWDDPDALRDDGF